MDCTDIHSIMGMIIPLSFAFVLCFVVLIVKLAHLQDAIAKLGAAKPEPVEEPK